MNPLKWEYWDNFLLNQEASQRLKRSAPIGWKYSLNYKETYRGMVKCKDTLKQNRSRLLYK